VESTARDELEAALVAYWNHDDLSVYADHLLAQGDPRGELIALDLAPAPNNADWVARRRAVITRWLGNELGLRAYGVIKHGFIHDLDDGKGLGTLTAPLLDSPAGTYVRSFASRGPATKVRATLARLAARERPWLTRLFVAVRSGPMREPSVNPATGDALVAATPRLQELDVRGRRVFGDLAHPTLRRLHLSNHDSVANPVPTTRLRITCATSTGQFARAVPPDEVRRALVEVAAMPKYDQLYAAHGDAFGEPLPALLARLEEARLVEIRGAWVELSAMGRGVQAGRLELPVVRRPLERPLEPVAGGHRANNVWLETKNAIAFAGNASALSRQLCAWLARLPLGAAARRILEDYLDLLHDLRRATGAHAAFAVNGGLHRVLEQITALQDDGVDPRRDTEDSVWQQSWSDVRGSAFRELLRTAIGQRMTFVLR
jgi:hypothetical protein